MGVLEERCEDAVFISTELTDQELKEFYSLATRGIFSPNAIDASSFASVGIDLNSLAEVSTAEEVSNYDAYNPTIPIKHEVTQIKVEPFGDMDIAPIAFLDPKGYQPKIKKRKRSSDSENIVYGSEETHDSECDSLNRNRLKRPRGRPKKQKPDKTKEPKKQKKGR